MPYLLTWSSRIHSPCIIAMLHSMGLSINMHGECECRKKPYWYHNMAYSIEPYLVYHDFPNLVGYNGDGIPG